jgi:hypothetical protein
MLICITNDIPMAPKQLPEGLEIDLELNLRMLHEAPYWNVGRGQGFYFGCGGLNGGGDGNGGYFGYGKVNGNGKGFGKRHSNNWGNSSNPIYTLFGGEQRGYNG